MTQVCIVDSNLVSPLGDGIEENFAAIQAGQVARSEISHFELGELPQRWGGCFTNSFRIKLKDNNDYEDTAYGLLVHTIKPMLDKIQHGSIGLILGSNFGLTESREWCLQEFYDIQSIDEDLFDWQQNFIPRLRKEFGIGGPATHLSLSCASGAAAVDLGARWLKAKRCEHVLVLCYDILTEFCWTGLANLRTITTDQVRPFSPDRSGTIFSEGAAAILLSRELAGEYLIVGSATNNNAFHMTAPAKRADGSKRVMQQAIQNAGLKNTDVKLISAHATSTQANDLTESQAIVDTFGDQPPGNIALKGNLGHMLGAAGLAEIVMTLSCMQKSQIPPMAGNEGQLDPECIAKPILHATKLNVPCAVTNSAGIGGNNASIVIQRREESISAPEPKEMVAAKPFAVSCLVNEHPADLVPIGDLKNLLEQNETLGNLVIKDFISPKGYLDPCSRNALIATANLLKKNNLDSKTAVVSTTSFGPMNSTFKFFELLRDKGHRFASPLIFPHSYPNTAGNLIAIEYDLGGPHYCFDYSESAYEAVQTANMILEQGQADKVLLVAYEGIEGTMKNTYPLLLNGAVATILSKPLDIPESQYRTQFVHGTVASLIQALQ